MQESKQSFSVNQHFYLLEICLWQKNELDPRVMPSTKKLKKLAKNPKFQQSLS
jgi:hypothetical protein